MTFDSELHIYTVWILRSYIEYICYPVLLLMQCMGAVMHDSLIQGTLNSTFYLSTEVLRLSAESILSGDTAHNTSTGEGHVLRVRACTVRQATIILGVGLKSCRARDCQSWSSSGQIRAVSHFQSKYQQKDRYRSPRVALNRRLGGGWVQWLGLVCHPEVWSLDYCSSTRARV